MLLRSLAALTALSAPVSAQSFGLPQSFPVGGRPAGLSIGDVDGDGQLDAAMALRVEDAVSVVLGDGAGGFGAPIVTPTPSEEPVDVALGDLDGDGILDLVTADRESESASVMLGVGDGTFTPASTLFVLGVPSQVLVVDLDLDGDLDVVTGTEYSVDFISGAGDEGELRVFENDGSGAFTLADRIELTDTTLDLVEADLNGDGLPEVIASSSWNGTVILENQGALSFNVAGGPGTFGGFTASADFADIDGDGDLDIAWVEEDGIDSDVEMAPNSGFGGFLPVPFITPLFTNEIYDRVRFGNVDGDSEPDIVASGTFQQFLAPTSWVHVRRGAPGFAIAPTLEKFTFDGRVVDMALADLDGDGLSDVVLTETPGQQIVVIRSSGCGASPSVEEFGSADLPVVSAPGSSFLLGGCGFESVTGVALDGQPLPFELDVDYGSAAIAVELPPALTGGPKQLTLTTPGGTLVETLDVGPVPTPALALDPPAELPISGSATLWTAADPGGLAFVGVSTLLAPTNLPGLLSLDIGAGGTQLVPVTTLALDPALGAASLPIPTAGLPSGLTVYFQAAVVTVPTAQLPLPSTNVVAATVVP